MNKWSNVMCKECGYRLEYCICPPPKTKDVIGDKFSEFLESQGHKVIDVTAPQAESWEIPDQLQFDLSYIYRDNYAPVNETLAKGKKVLQSFLHSNREEVNKELIKKLPKPKKTCNCEESELGYHTKECTFFDYGWNACLEKVKSIIKGEQNSRKYPYLKDHTPVITTKYEK